MNETPFGDYAFNELKRIFGHDNVIREWSVAKNSQDAFTRDFYCPRVDYAVGPFNIDAMIDDNNRRINDTYQDHRELLRRLEHASNRVNEIEMTNPNPRCFLAIELENMRDPKHELGSLINASAIGKIGIVITENDVAFNSFVRIKKYLDYLLDVKKTRFAPKNILILRKQDFIDVLAREE